MNDPLIENSKEPDPSPSSQPLNIPKKHRDPLKITDHILKKRIEYAESISPLKGMTRSEKKKEIKMPEEEKELNRKILYNMNVKLNFKKNPRYKENSIIPSYKDAVFENISSNKNPFSIEPQEVVFRDYQANCVYQIDLKILNRTQLLTSFKYVPPITENFAIKEIIYPKKDSSLIAPGMYAKMQVVFHATSMENFEDEITILTEKMAFKVPLKGVRDKPALSLSNPMDCKKCFIGDRVEMHFTCKNNGGDAHFRFLPVENEEDKAENGHEDIMGNTPNELLSVGPFTIFPQEFYLYKGMAQNITVNFAANREGIIERKLNLVCENSNLQYILRGEGIKVDIAIKMLDGLSMEGVAPQDDDTHNEQQQQQLNELELKRGDSNVSRSNNNNNIIIDAPGDEQQDAYKDNESDKSNLITEDKGETLSIIYFKDTFPHTSTSRVLVLQNTSSVPVKYHWTIYDIYHQNEFSMLPDENFFSIEPEDGTFQPFQELSFKINFNPLNSKIYEQKLELIIENIPFPAIKQFVASSSTIKNSYTKAEPYLPGFNSSFPSYPLYSFTLKGKGKLPSLIADKYYIDLGNVYLGKEACDSFTVTNNDTGVSKFKATKIIQKLLTANEKENGINIFYKDNCLKDDVIIKNKSTLLQKTVEIPNDLTIDNEYKTNYVHTDVEYLNIVTYEENFNDYIEKNQPISTVNTQQNINTNQSQNQNQNQNQLNKADTVMLKLKKKKGTISNTDSSYQPTEIKKTRPLKLDQFIQVKMNQNINFDITFKADKMGLFKSSIIFTLDDGLTFCIDIIANVIGPSMSVNTAFIDFGLFPINKVQKQSFEIQNTSPIPCRYLIKEQRYTAVTLSNYKNINYIDDYEGEINDSSLLHNNNEHKNEIDSLLDYDNRDMLTFDIQKVDSYIMKFSSVHGTLQPNETKLIDVYFISPFPIYINTNNTIEVICENGNTNYFNYIVQCEEAEAYIENTYIIPKEIFLTMPIKTSNNNTIRIINPSNLPINFKWDNIFEADRLIAEFEPNKGTIPPHSTQDITFKIIYFFIDHIDNMFICHINEMDVPLGVIVQGDVIGLDIGYEFTEESYNLIKAVNRGIPVASTMLGDNTNPIGREVRKRKTRLSTLMSSQVEEEEEVDLKFNQINIRNLKVNSPMEIMFKIKNFSGIPTQFNLVIDNYPPGKEKIVRIDKDHTTTNITKLSKLSKRTYKGNTKFKIDHLLLSAAHEEINFTSPKGMEFTKMRQIEKDSVLYLSNKKGVAIVIEPKRGKLEPHSECLIKVSFFNECVGEFHDILTSHVKGLSPVTFPIDLRIKGNPLQLSPFQPGINYLLDPPLMKVGNILRNVGVITKNVKLVNIGTNTIALDWKIYDMEDFLKPKDRNIFNIKITERRKGRFKLDFIAEPPREFPEDKQYFTITPTHAVIGPKGNHDFTITFKTDTAGQKEALFIAYPKIEGDNEGNVTFNELPLKVMACGLKPHLTVDKPLNYENKYEYKFYLHSYGKHPKPKRPVILINKEKINMIVKIDIEGPFKIDRAEPIEAIMDNNYYNIIPNSNLKLDISFKCPSPFNEEEWPMLLVQEKFGKIKVTFENNEQEEFNLRAILMRPRILLSFTGNESVESLDYVNFGYVNCASRKIVNMFLMNETEVDTNWKINYVKFVPKAVYGYGTITKDELEDQNMSDDPSVFDFDLSEGMIYGPSNMLIDLPLGPALPVVEVKKDAKYKPLCIKVMFRPKKNIFYKCRYKITTNTGNTIDFILKGNGSYLEEHIIE